MRPRIIPCLLLTLDGLVKTKKFKNPIYIGDPVNSVRIFNDKEADELMVLDISATKEKREPQFQLIEEMAGEAFMPVAYGGGVSNIEQITRLIRAGVEKVVINTMATKSTDLLRTAVDIFGSQAIVASVDVKRKFFGRYSIVAMSGCRSTQLDLQNHIDNLINAGVGELFINDVDRDGCMCGYDLNMIKAVSEIPIPIVVCGGAGNLVHMKEAINVAGASAVAAGSMFVFHGKHRAVMIDYPDQTTIEKIFCHD